MKQIDLSKTDFVVIDVESTGLNVRKDKVIGVGFAISPTQSMYIPLLEWCKVTNQLRPTQHKQKIFNLLQFIKNNKKIICHNAAYDLRIIKNDLGIDLIENLAYDTILLKHTVDENPPFGLKEIAVKLKEELGFDRDPTEEKKALKASIELNGGSTTKTDYQLYKADQSVIGEYCEQDCRLTYSVFEFYKRQIDKVPSLVKLYEEEVLPLYKYVSIPMMDRGIKLDVEAISKAYGEIKADLTALEDEVQQKLAPYSKDFKNWFYEKEYAPSKSGAFAKALVEVFQLPLPLTKTGAPSLAKAALESLPESEFKTFLLTESGLSADKIEKVQDFMHQQEGRYFININSKDHLKRIVFNYLKEKPFRYTDKGAWQLDDNFLQSIASKYEFIPPLLVYNKLNKIKSTYMEQFLSAQEDSIFYPEFNQHRTISGRFGSNIQQLPRKKEDGHPLILKYNNMIRNFFISRDGYSFVDDDYESLEPHIFAHISGDPGIIEIFNVGDDFYSKIAIMTERLKGVSANKKADNYLGKIDKAARQKAKAYSLGIPYGLQDFKLSKELNISQDEAKRLINQYLDAFPKLREWMEKTDLKVITDGYIDSQLGRRRNMTEAVEIYNKHGLGILDSLELWKQYHENKDEYERMKELRNKLKNYLNNGKNFQVQSMAASVVNRACINIAKEFKKQNIDAHIVGQIHDEILIESNDSQLDKVCKIVQDCMENVVQLSVKLKATPSIAKTYGEAK